MPNTFDVVAIGDTTEDIFLGMSDVSLQCDVDNNHCKICFDYAEKIGVDSKVVVPAVGNAANHAIGVARLGLRSAIYSVVGNDTVGHVSKTVFEDNQVDTRYLVFDEEHGTNLSVVINVKSERTIFVYHEPRTYQLPALESTGWIYLTSASGDGVTQLHEQVLTYVEDHPEVKLAFNPGTYQLKLGREALLPLLSRTAVLFLNREESMRVLATKITDTKQLLQEFIDLGVGTMVLTDGPKGAYTYDGNKMWHQAIYNGPVVERTGAGDAYGSGVVSALIQGKSITEAMTWGNANSTSVVGYVGAREGLLTPAKLESLIAQNSDIIPTQL